MLLRVSGFIILKSVGERRSVETLFFHHLTEVLINRKTLLHESTSSRYC